MIWATVSSWSRFWWLYRGSPSLAGKNIISLISVLTICWCPCVESAATRLSRCSQGRGPGAASASALGYRMNQGKDLQFCQEKCTGHSKHPLPTTQEKTLHMDITRWSTPKSAWLYSLQPNMEKLYRVNKNKTRSWLWLRSWTPYYTIQTQIE